LIDMGKDKRLWHMKSVNPQRGTLIQSVVPYRLTLCSLTSRSEELNLKYSTLFGFYLKAEFSKGVIRSRDG